MPKNCWAPGCKSGYASQKGIAEKRHFFQSSGRTVGIVAAAYSTWRDGMLSTNHVLRDLHFEDRLLLKTYSHVINGQRVKTARGKWDLTPDAVPTKFRNVPKYLSTKVPKSRKRKPRLPVTNNSKDYTDGTRRSICNDVSFVLHHLATIYKGHRGRSDRVEVVEHRQRFESQVLMQGMRR